MPGPVPPTAWTSRLSRGGLAARKGILEIDLARESHLEARKIMNVLPSACAASRVLVVLILAAHSAVGGEPARPSSPASPRKRGLSPVAMVPTADGKRLYIACAAARGGPLDGSSDGCDRPSLRGAGRAVGSALSADGAKLFVTCAAAASRICEFETARGVIVAMAPAGYSAGSPVLAPDGKTLYVCNRFDDSVTIHDVARRADPIRIAVPRQPVALDITPDGTVAGRPSPARGAGGPGRGGGGGERDRRCDAAGRQTFDSAQRQRAAGAIKVSPDGRLAAVTHNLARFQMPTTQVDRGWMNTAALTLIDVPGLSVINTVLLDNVDRGAANPWAIGWTADGKNLAVTHAGTHDLSVIDVPALLANCAVCPARPDPARPVDPYSASRVAADVPNDLAFLVGLRSRVRLSGNGPRALAIVGAKLFVANYFSDTVERVDLQTPSLTPVTIALGPPAALSVVRRGEMLFNDATISFQGWQSCASCHSQDAQVSTA